MAATHQAAPDGTDVAESDAGRAASRRDGPEIIRLSGLRKGLLVLLLLVLTGLFLAGTVVGEDNWWPFGPWRMFATSTAPSGSIYSTGIEVREGTDPTWRPAPLNPTSVGLNRAEVEGRIPQLTANPQMLATLAASHERLRPGEPAWRAIRVVRSQIVLANGSPTGEVVKHTLAQWVAP